MKRSIAILMLAFCGIANGQRSISTTTKDLAAVQWFAFGGTGYAGTTSQGELNFRIIMAQEPSAALATFEKLLATGNPQAKGYALAGIRKLDPNRFQRLLPSFRDSREDVQTMEGCIVDHERLSALANAIANGRYDLWIDRAQAR